MFGNFSSVQRQTLVVMFMAVLMAASVATTLAVVGSQAPS